MTKWLEITGYEKYYQVSNTGIVKSMGRLVHIPQRNRTSYDLIVGEKNYLKEK